AADGVEADVLADIDVQDELHPALDKLPGAPLDHLLFQLEAGDAIDHQPAGAVVAVIDRDLEAHAAQPVGGGQPAGSRADDADGFGPFLQGRGGLDPALFPGGVGDVFLDRADGDGAVAGLFDDAVAFA